MRAIVIGAGASGMTAALTAARLGHSVMLIERQARVGRKLMATGNGHCNLTNTGASPEHYHGADVCFMRTAMEKLPPEEALEFFRQIGLLTVTESGGRVYPLSNSANSVVDVLRYALEAAGVELHSGDRAVEIRGSAGDFRVVTEGGARLGAEAVVVACGGLAGEKLGGGRDGYELLKSLGHSRTALRPALVQIATAPEYPRALKGIKADCALTLRSGGSVIARSAGELLFTETGVSRPGGLRPLARRLHGRGHAHGARTGPAQGVCDAAGALPPLRAPGERAPAALRGAVHRSAAQPAGPHGGEIRRPGRRQTRLRAHGSRALPGGCRRQMPGAARPGHRGLRRRAGHRRGYTHLRVRPADAGEPSGARCVRLRLRRWPRPSCRL